MSLCLAMDADARELDACYGHNTDHDEDSDESLADHDDHALDDDSSASHSSFFRLGNISILGLGREISIKIYTFICLFALLSVVDAFFPVAGLVPCLEPWMTHLWYILRELIIWSFIGCMASVMISYFGSADFGKKALWFVGFATVLAILTVSVLEMNIAGQPTDTWEIPIADNYDQVGNTGERQICDGRLADFYDKWYWQSLFARSLHPESEDEEWFCGLPVHQTHSFTADQDTYGIGTRGGLYLQWLVALVANNFLAGMSHEIQKVGLVLSVVICLVTLRLSRLDLCVFTIEIEIVYWLFWGSFISVFASAPSRLRLIFWNLNLVPLILLSTSGFMATHGARFLWSAHETVFQRTPCGSWHLWGFPVLDASEIFEILSHKLRVLLVPVMVIMSFGFLLLASGFISGLTKTIKHSPMFLGYLGRAAPPEHDVVAGKEASAKESNGIPNQVLLHRMLHRIKKAHIATRDLFFPSDGTTANLRPFSHHELRRRTYRRIGLLILGLSTIVLSIAAIELTLSWNNVANIYSLQTDIEYLVPTVAIISLVNVCHGLGQQELGRRQRIRMEQARRRGLDPRKQKITDQTGVDAEISSLKAAVRYAWLGVDPGFPITVCDKRSDALLP
ncbi:hypothetical protein F5Y19DRAFT_429964 [Xylariaceae sp. FL1651]|nr:hypothetical protein F5Y19DRAFT_429964 [Xylariaceae sp. FL1651]